MCPKGTRPPPGKPPAKRRERTDEEITAVNAICSPCKYFKHGMCMILIRAGCGSCKNADDFAAKIRRGIGCPDSPPRFEGTPVE